MERTREIEITIRIETNKRTIVESFYSAATAIEWLLEHKWVVLVSGIGDEWLLDPEQ